MTVSAKQHLSIKSYDSYDMSHASNQCGLDKFFDNQACATVLGITLMKQLNVRRCKRLRVAKGTTHIYVTYL